jgi:hypothetical protein
MATGTEERLGELRRRIDRLEASARSGATDATSRLQRHVTTLRRDEQAARASARQHAAAVEEQLAQLGNDLDIAEHRLAAELADDRKRFAHAVEAELHDWDVFLERMQAKAAHKKGAARSILEESIADFRRRRCAASEGLAGVRASTGEQWRDARKRVLASLDELKRRVDTVRKD